MRRVIVTVSVMMFILAGCATLPINGDPNVGTRRVLDPNNPTLISAEVAAEGLGGILALMGLPAVGGIITGAVGIWKGLKPKIVAAQQKANEAERKEALATAAAQTTVDGIEELKRISPDSWEKLKPIYTDMLKTAPSIEAFLRELRGLPVDKPA
jgi:hypothetical protein